MALETLAGIREIGGYKVVNMSELEQLIRGVFSHDDSAKIERAVTTSAYIRHHGNAISFKLQDGTIKEKGMNGCQVDTMIETAKIIIEGLNRKFPSPNNERCIEHLDAALIALTSRKKERESRGVEGTSQI